MIAVLTVDYFLTLVFGKNRMKYAGRVTNLNKSFGGLAVDNLSIQIPEVKLPQSLGFFRRWKSTFLKHLLGLIYPDDGEIKVEELP